MNCLEYLVYITLAIFWKYAHVKTAPRKSPGAMDSVYTKYDNFIVSLWFHITPLKTCNPYCHTPLIINSLLTLRLFFTDTLQFFAERQNDTKSHKTSKKYAFFLAHENMKKTLSKVAHNRPHFFSVLTTSPKSAQISFYVQYEWLPAQLLYNDKKQNKNTSGE